MITITIRRVDNKLVSIMDDSEVLYQGEPTEYTTIYTEEVPPTSVESQPERK